MITPKDVKGLIEKEIGSPVGENTKLSDLGMDSLDKLNLSVQLETKLGVIITLNSLSDADTVGDLIDTVLDSSASN